MSGVWIDGSFDCPNWGHLNALRQARELGDELIVGVHDDDECASNNIDVLLTMTERAAVIEACKWVDRVVLHAPYVTSTKVMDDHGCSICAFGEIEGRFTSDSGKENDSYSDVRQSGRLRAIKHADIVATSDFIGRLMLGTNKHHLPLAEVKAHEIYFSDVISPHSARGSLAAARAYKLAQFKGPSKSSNETRANEKNGKTIYVDGAFDFFHAGHVKFLEKAKELGDQLFVGLFSDEDVNSYKGSNQPIMNIEERALSLLSCKYVDKLIIGAPLIITKEFMNECAIDLVVYGASGEPCSTETGETPLDNYRIPREMQRLQPVHHEMGDLTTTEILRRIIDKHSDLTRGVGSIEQHGGQQWKQLGTKLIEDFSLTCNCIGTPKFAMRVAQDAMNLVCHYPPDDQEPAFSALAEYICPEDPSSAKQLMVLGNGASELIDVIIRNAQPGPFRPGPFRAQFKEYERSSKSSGRKILGSNDVHIRAGVIAIVNPCNPTGEFLSIDELKDWIEAAIVPFKPLTVLIDESMLPWIGPDWRKYSFVSQRKWITSLLDRDVKVFVMFSWTKIWTCPGLRIGCVVAPSPQAMKEVMERKVPWSVNVLALEFTAAAIKDTEYMETTWTNTRKWRQQFVDKLALIQPNWKVYGEPWISWVWIDCVTDLEAHAAVNACLNAGCPIRAGRVGYNMDSFIRISVRPPSKHRSVLDALKTVQC